MTAFKRVVHRTSEGNDRCLLNLQYPISRRYYSQKLKTTGLAM